MSSQPFLASDQSKSTRKTSNHRDARFPAWQRGAGATAPAIFASWPTPFAALWRLMRLFFLITATMIAFAANSVLTRTAVDGGHMDPAGFAILRVAAGAAVLATIVRLRKGRLPLWRRERISGALSLAIYMIGFSLAYLTLDAGLGALILFGVVQVTMFLHGSFTRRVPTPRQLLGASIAFAGLALALWPGSNGGTDAAGAAWMVLAGVGWAGYTIVGRSATDPLAATGANFLFCLPILCVALLGSSLETSPTGMALGVVCGGLTSGLGYALWYSVLPRIQSNSAAIVQLSVPIIAILAGVVLLGEVLTWQVTLSSILVLGGIAFAVRSQHR